MKTTFTRLPLDEQRLMLSQLAHLMRKNEWYFKQVEQLLRIGEVKGELSDVKFGNQVETKSSLK